MPSSRAAIRSRSRQGLAWRRLAWRRRYPGLPGVVVVLDGKPRHLLERRLAMLATVARVDPVLRDADAPTISLALLEDLQRHGPFAGVRPRAPAR